jgi:hypothetical protein
MSQVYQEHKDADGQWNRAETVQLWNIQLRDWADRKVPSFVLTLFSLALSRVN